VVLGSVDLAGINWFRSIEGDATIEIVARLGVVILLFEVGLESTVRDMPKVGLTGVVVAGHSWLRRSADARRDARQAGVRDRRDRPTARSSLHWDRDDAARRGRLIFANIGLGLSLAGQPIVDQAIFSAVVIMVIVTTMATPPLLKWSLARRS
jgi:Kef-type K+ transport system membrane component KefB